MRKIILLITGFIFLFASVGRSQEDAVKTDPSGVSDISLSIFNNVRPLMLKKGQVLINFRSSFLNYYKIYSQQTGKPEKIPSVVVWNESYFNGYVTYGLSDKWNLFLELPFANIHHYSPMGRVSGVCFGDIKAGVDYQLMKKAGDALAARVTLGFPTGTYKNLDAGQYPTGLGSFTFKAQLSGMHQFKKVQMLYSGYYDYRTNRQGISTGDETGLWLIFRKPFKTGFGLFGIEGGTTAYWNFADKKDGAVLPNTADYSVDLYVGGWFQYMKKFNIRFAVPYSIYQNNSWLTRYTVMIQFDYLLK